MKKHIRLNDRGLSLVELLVAVAILALVAVPVTRSFITAQRVSVKAAELNNATECARNVAESINAMEMGALTAMMRDDDPPLFAGGTIGSPASYDNAGNENDSITDGAAGYEFNLTGLEYSGSEFDAVVTLAADEAVNDTDIPQYTPMDAVFAQPSGAEDPDTLASEYFTDTAAAMYGTAGSITRRISVSLAGDEKSVSAAIEYSYSCQVTYKQLEGEPVQFPGDLHVSYTYSAIGENDAEDGKSPAVYIMFYKCSLPSEEFNVTCDSSVTVPLFLVDQDADRTGYSISVNDNTNVEVYSNVLLTGSKVYAESRENRLYNVTITLYAPGNIDTGESVYTLNTTKLD